MPARVTAAEAARMQADIIAGICDRLSQPALWVLGLDPSLREFGVAVQQRDGRVQTSVLRTEPDPTLPRYGLEHRVNRIKQKATAILDAFPVDLAVIETPIVAIRGGNDVWHAQAVVRDLLYERQVPFVDVSVLTLKVFALGSAKDTSKTSMVLAAERLLRPACGWAGDIDGEADAAWIAELGWHLLGVPHLDLPATHTRALDTVRTPKAKKGARASKTAAQRRLRELSEAVA